MLLCEFYAKCWIIFTPSQHFLSPPHFFPAQAGVLSFLVIQDQFSSAEIVLGSWSATEVWLTYLGAALLEETLALPAHNNRHYRRGFFPIDICFC